MLVAKAKAPKTPKRKMGRSVISKVQLSLGLVTITGNLCAVRKSESSSKPTVNGEKVTVESACPTCFDATGDFTKVNQRYVCEDDPTHGPFGRGDVLKAVDGQVIGTSEEYLASAKDDDDDSGDEIKNMILVPHLAEEVEQSTIFTGAAYAFAPAIDSAIYDILVSRIGADGAIDLPDGRRVLVGEVLSRGTKSLYQLRTWNGQLIAQELARPEYMYEMEAKQLEVNEAYDAMFATLVETSTEPFDPATYEDESRKRLEEFVNSRTGEDGPKLAGSKSETLKAAGEDAMLAMLAASVDAARARKAS